MGIPDRPSPAAEQYDYTTAYREHGNGVYLAEGETVESVVENDLRILERHGVTPERVGASLRKLLDTFDTFQELRDPGPQHPCPGVTLTRQVFLLGYEPCPYLDDATSSIDWRIHVDGLTNGNKARHPTAGPTFVSDMLPDMISRLGFFEGNVFYGIDPEWAVEIHRLVEGNNLTEYQPRYAKSAWERFGIAGQKYPEGVADFIIRYASQVEEVLPGVTAHIAPGDIAPYGFDPYNAPEGRPPSIYHSKHHPHDGRTREAHAVVEAAEDVRVPPDLLINGLPIGKYTYDFRREQRHLLTIWPYSDKQVG